MTQRPPLRQHRQCLAANPNAFTQDLPRAKRTVIAHLQECGYTLLRESRPQPAVAAYVDAIFETQAHQPFFNIPSELPYCWNAPMHWDKNYIRYEWGHLRSRNQNKAVSDITNLCLQSARCNQHVQTSMDIEEVYEWLNGSQVALRIAEILEARKQLFSSPRWETLIADLNQFRPASTVDFF
jgi:hypothetical protein